MCPLIVTKLINWETRSVSVFRLSSFLPYSQCHGKDDDTDVVEEDETIETDNSSDNSITTNENIIDEAEVVEETTGNTEE